MAAAVRVASNVVFRRINGRVIPIRVDDNRGSDKQDKQKQLARGVAQTAAGAAVAGISGHLVSGVYKKAVQAAQNSRRDYKFGKKARDMFASGQMSFFEAGHVKSGEAVMRSAVTKRFLARSAFRLRDPLLAAGTLAGAGLIYAGVKNVQESRDKKVNPEATAGAATLVASVLSSGFYYHGVGVRRAVDLVRNVVARHRGVRRPVQVPFPGKYGPTKI
jgi:hypothetical protein